MIKNNNEIMNLLSDDLFILIKDKKTGEIVYPNIKKDSLNLIAFTNIITGPIDQNGYYQNEQTGCWYKLFKKSDEKYEVLTFVDVTDEKNKLDAKGIDNLTGLMDRDTVEMASYQYIKYAVEKKQPFAFMFFDVDSFKQVNDRYGHLCGDMALRKISDTFSAYIRSDSEKRISFYETPEKYSSTILEYTDICGRSGGDEFLMILKNIDEASLRKKIDILSAVVNGTTIRYNDKTIPLSVSWGIKHVSEKDLEKYKENNLTPKEIFKIVKSESDKALYYSKNHNKGAYTIYDPKDHKVLVYKD